MTINDPAAIARTPYWAFVQALAGGDVDTLAAFFAGEPDIDDPLRGRYVGRDRLSRLTKDWVGRRGLGASEIAPLHLTETEGFALLEFAAPNAPVLDPDQPTLDVGVVFERAVGGFSAARVYFATGGYRGTHGVRGRLLADEDGLHEFRHPAVERYHHALRGSQLEELLAQISPEGRARAGESPTFVGAEQVRAFFEWMFQTGGGGFHLEHARMFQDDQSVVLEFTATRWGAHTLAPQAGVAVYTVGIDGLIRHIRIYDEIGGVTPVADTGDLGLALQGGVYRPAVSG